MGMEMRIRGLYKSGLAAIKTPFDAAARFFAVSYFVLYATGGTWPMQWPPTPLLIGCLGLAVVEFAVTYHGRMRLRAKNPASCSPVES